ncbi:unnamed protein product, partial [Brenthis ino]
MDKFDIKTATSLIPVMDNTEEITENIINGIEMYNEYLVDVTQKKLLISFVLKTRLSKSAKLKLKSEYDDVTSLIQDIRKFLLTKKSANSILTQLNNLSQNNMSIHEFGDKLSELFVGLTIAQSDGNPKSCEILRPINEKLAVKRFADGLRNRRLSTIISARDYSSLKDAVRAAEDEELGQPSLSNNIFNAQRRGNQFPYYRSSLRGRGGQMTSRDNQKCSWLVDTGASLSAIRSNILSERIPIHRDPIVINGIGGRTYSDGYVYLTLQASDGTTYEHKFYLFKNLPCNDLIKKWRSVKDNYFRYSKKLKEASKSGSGATKLKKYHLYNQLLFLRKVEQNATESSLDSPREINNESTSTNDDITTDNTPRYVPVARKRAMQMDEFEREGLKLLKEPENRHMSFFRAILPSIQEFSDRETLRFQSKVIQIIDEMRYGQTSSYQRQTAKPVEPSGTNRTVAEAVIHVDEAKRTKAKLRRQRKREKRQAAQTDAVRRTSSALSTRSLSSTTCEVWETGNKGSESGFLVSYSGSWSPQNDEVARLREQVKRLTEYVGTLETKLIKAEKTAKEAKDRVAELQQQAAALKRAKLPPTASDSRNVSPVPAKVMWEEDVEDYKNKAELADAEVKQIKSEQELRETKSPGAYKALSSLHQNAGHAHR